MAIAKCRECGKEVSDEAARCPYCGIARPVRKPVGAAGILLAGVVGLLLFKACSPAGEVPKTAKPAADLSSSARYVCKDFITRSGYNVPDFGEWSAWTAIDNKDGTWSVGAKFMGAAPGGQIRNLYVTCVMSNSGDNWSLQKLSRLR